MLPDPKLDWNPKLKAGQGTLVSLDTWFGQGAISPQPDPRTADVNIQVDEVQTLVTNAR